MLSCHRPYTARFLLEEKNTRRGKSGDSSQRASSDWIYLLIIIQFKYNNWLYRSEEESEHRGHRAKVFFTFCILFLRSETSLYLFRSCKSCKQRWRMSCDCSVTVFSVTVHAALRAVTDGINLLFSAGGGTMTCFNRKLDKVLKSIKVAMSTALYVNQIVSVCLVMLNHFSVS